jgi:hypothetical protein
LYAPLTEWTPPPRLHPGLDTDALIARVYFDADVWEAQGKPWFISALGTEYEQAYEPCPYSSSSLYASMMTSVLHDAWQEERRQAGRDRDPEGPATQAWRRWLDEFDNPDRYRGLTGSQHAEEMCRVALELRGYADAVAHWPKREQPLPER